MVFLTREYSSYDGEPVLLYQFRRGTLLLNYTNADRDVTVAGVTWRAQPISHNGVRQQGDAVADTVQITCPASLEIAAWFQFTPPSDVVYVTILRFHYGDPAGVIVWLGSVVSSGTSEIGKATINCHAVSVSLKRGGLRLGWQRGCPHALYDQNCRADKTLHAVTTTVLIVGYNQLGVAAFPTTQHWPGGFLEWQIADSTFERRLIEDTIGNNSIVPYGNMDGYTVGQELTMYPGCLRTSIHCDTFFNNLVNYGGFEFMPNRSPYDGDPVF